MNHFFKTLAFKFLCLIEVYWAGFICFIDSPLKLLFITQIQILAIAYDYYLESKLQIDLEKKHKYFYHDILNHVHGIGLFLGHKISSKENINTEDSLLLENEVRILKSLLKDHYNLEHQNLYYVYKNIDFNLLEETTIQLLNSCLPNKYEVNFNLTGDSDSKVYFPVFYRVFQNLIKNISDLKNIKANILIEERDGFLKMIIKNEMPKPIKVLDLSKIILNPKDQKRVPQGLNSVGALCSESGGDFSFSIQDNMWISEVLLPIKKGKKEENQTAA